MIMKHTSLTLSLLSLLVLLGMAACTADTVGTPETPDPVQGDRTFTLHVSNPTKSGLRAIVKDLNSDDIILKWDKDAFAIHLIYSQEGMLIDGGRIAPSLVTIDGLEALMDFTLPQSVDINKPFDLYAVIGQGVKIRDGKILTRVDAHTMYALTETSSNKDDLAPMYAEIKGITLKDRELEAEFIHLGTMASVVIKNSSDKPFRISGLAMLPKDETKAFYLPGSLPFAGNADLPYLDILDQEAKPVMIRTEVTYPVYDIAPGEISYGGFWFRPTGEECPETVLAAYDTTTREAIRSKQSKPARAALEIGKAYALYAEWDGKELKLLDEEPENPLPADQPYIELTTTKAVGETIKLNIDAPMSERINVWVDLNNDGKRERGEYVTSFTDEKRGSVIPFKLGSQTIRIYGEVTALTASKQDITAIDASNHPGLESLTIDENPITKLELGDNKSLQYLSAYDCEIETVRLPFSIGLQEIYLAGNKLKSLMIFAPGMYGFDVSDNPDLSSLKLAAGSYPMLMVADFNGCNLDKDMIEGVYNKFAAEQSIPKYYDWMYTVHSYDNPGSKDADFMIAVNKGWTVYQTSKDTPDGKE